MFKYGNNFKNIGFEAATGFKSYLHHYLRDSGLVKTLDLISQASVCTFVEWNSSCITGLS